MPQAIQIETQTEQQGPTLLRPQLTPDGYFVQVLQEAVQSREVGLTSSRRLSQFAMLTQPHLGFAKGPTLKVHRPKAASFETFYNRTSGPE
ncbi:MAG: hypothetical protein WB795_24550 [Candidatus Acidiferrales bacterium]